jgi:magnesium-transporting ATPase (P-type)
VLSLWRIKHISISNIERESLLTMSRYRKLSIELSKDHVEAEKNLIFLGLVAFQDPPKASAAVAIKRLINRGVRIKVLTGDNHIVAEAVCEQVGLAIDTESRPRKLVVMTGTELATVGPDDILKFCYWKQYFFFFLMSLSYRINC